LKPQHVERLSWQMQLADFSQLLNMVALASWLRTVNQKFLPVILQTFWMIPHCQSACLFLQPKEHADTHGVLPQHAFVVPTPTSHLATAWCVSKA